MAARAETGKKDNSAELNYLSTEQKDNCVERNYLFEVYSIPIGNTKPTHFYHPKLVIEEAMTIRDASRRNPLVHWLIETGNQVIQQGFAIDTHALKHDPTVLPNIMATTQAHHFSPARQAIAGKSHLFDWVYSHLLDGRLTDGTLNVPAWTHFRKCVYNTTHLGSVGMTALQIRYTRANPNVIDFGLINFRGEKYPNKIDRRTAANLLHDYELLGETGLIDLGLAGIMQHLHTVAPLTVSEALRLYNWQVSTHSNFLPNPPKNWIECLETPIDNIVNLPNKSVLRAQIQADLRTYESLWVNRSTLSDADLAELERTKQSLVMENLTQIDVNGNVPDPLIFPAYTDLF